MLPFRPTHFFAGSKKANQLDGAGGIIVKPRGPPYRVTTWIPDKIMLPSGADGNEIKVTPLKLVVD